MQTKKPWRVGTRAHLLLRGLRYKDILAHVSIDGWLAVDEAIELYELARGLPDERPLAVEIGSWQGKSSVCIGRGLLGKREPRLVCIDPFDAAGDDASAGEYHARQDRLGGPLRSAFEQNLRDAAVRDLVDVRAGLSQDFAAGFTKPIDLLFLDGNHAYDAVRRDFLDWAGKVAPGGVLVLHDVVHTVHDGPRRVVDELVLPDPRWVNGRYVESMFVVQRARS